jgi:hypothetical protein
MLTFRVPVAWRRGITAVLVAKNSGLRLIVLQLLFVELIQRHIEPTLTESGLVSQLAISEPSRPTFCAR